MTAGGDAEQRSLSLVRNPDYFISRRLTPIMDPFDTPF
jgi:hypothetical protein